MLNLKTLIPDFFGGLAAMLVALPSAIAFGLIVYSPLGSAGIAQGAMSGIIGAITIGIIAPLLGGAPRLVSGPCGPAAAVLVALVTEMTAHSSAQNSLGHISIIIMTVVVFAGLIQFVIGVLGGGKLIKYIPYPVVAGYLSSVGLLICFGQLSKFFGVSNHDSLIHVIVNPYQWNVTAVTVGTVTVIAMIVAPRITRALPSVIIALVAGTLTYFMLGWFAFPDLLSLTNNYQVIGQIHTVGSSHDFFTNAVGQWMSISDIFDTDFRTILATSVTLAVLLSIDTLKTCVVLDTVTRSRHHSNKEIIGQGVSNMTSGLLGGLAGAGMMGATLVNVTSGGLTKLSGIFVGILALLTFLLFGNLVAWVPVSSLAGILIVVGIRMIDRSIFKLLFNKSTVLDFVIIAAVVLTALFSTLIVATAVGLIIAIFIFLREQIRAPVVRNIFTGNQIFSKKRRLPQAISILEMHGGQTIIVQLQGNLFFGTTDQLILELVPRYELAKCIILDFKRVTSLDYTAVHMLEQVEDKMTEKAGWLLFSDLPVTLPTGQDVKSYLNDAGLVRISGNLKIFPELNDALEWAEDKLLISYGVDISDDQPPYSISQIELLTGLDKTIIAELEKSVTQLFYEKGQYIFKYGDKADKIYFIRKGQVRILLPINDDKSRLIATIGRGDFLGDIAFLDGGTRSAHAIAATPSDVFVLSRHTFNQYAKNNPELAAKIFERLAYALAFRLRLTDLELSILEQR